MRVDRTLRPRPRYAPEMPMPPYTYVPGRSPHPTSDPGGHSFGKPVMQPELFQPDDWRRSTLYLYAVDLFNHGYYWEAHEAWETLWHASGRTGFVPDFFKGLIKLAAAGVKAREGIAAGVSNHARRAAELFRHTAVALGRSEFMGLNLDQLGDWASATANQPVVTAESPRPSVQPVFAFVLRLEVTED